MNTDETYFLPYQERRITDPSILRIIQKSRQVGACVGPQLRKISLHDAVGRASTQALHG
jgi:phage FluMu gp28-like protein